MRPGKRRKLTDSRGSRGAIRVVTRTIDQPPAAPCAQSRWLLRQRTGFVVWDTETTGLEDNSKIVSIGAVDQDGNTLLNQLINPGVPIPSDATAIHGVTDEMVADAPTFDQVYPRIAAALGGRRWVIYNANYDMPRLRYECERYGLPQIAPLQTRHTSNLYSWWYSWDSAESYCAMEMFAEYFGDFNDYFESYTWQKLTTAAKHFGIRVKHAHNALHDAITTYHVIRHMALNEDRSNEHEME